MNKTMSLNKIYAKLTAMSFIWGGTSIAGKTLVEEIGPFSTAFCRYILATLCLFLLVFKLEGGLPKLRRHQILPVVILGLTGVAAYNILFFLGLETTSASRAALIVTTNPAMIALGAALFLKDKLTFLKLTGILTALIGVTVVITQGHFLTLFSQGISIGDLFILACIPTWAIYTLVGRQVINSLSPLAATVYACLIGTPILLFPALEEGFLCNWYSFSVGSWINLLYLAGFGTTVAFWWYYEGVKTIGPAKASIFINFVPVITVILAALLLNEPITPVLLLGGFLVIVGISLTNQAR